MCNNNLSGWFLIEIVRNPSGVMTLLHFTNPAQEQTIDNVGRMKRLKKGSMNGTRINAIMKLT